MMNQVVMVGRIVREPELKETENGSLCNLTLAVPRSFKNAMGEYDTDFVDVTLWKSIAESTKEYCNKGDLVGVKGRIQTNSKEAENGERKNFMNIVAEKVTFLSSKRRDEQEQNYSRD